MCFNICFEDYFDCELFVVFIKVFQEFEGGVFIIMYNCDFFEFLCKEVWVMCDGRFEVFGYNWVEGQGVGFCIDKKDGEEDDQYDVMGNKIEMKKVKKIIVVEVCKFKKECIVWKKCGEEIIDDEL